MRVAAQNAEATTGHLRTGNGDHEVDFILQRADHKVVAIEVKLAGTVSDRTRCICAGWRTASGPTCSTPSS